MGCKQFIRFHARLNAKARKSEIGGETLQQRRGLVLTAMMYERMS